MGLVGLYLFGGMTIGTMGGKPRLMTLIEVIERPGED
jgi:hypothetical protein